MLRSVKRVIGLFLALAMPAQEARSDEIVFSLYEKMMAQEVALLGLSPQQRSEELSRTYDSIIEISAFRDECNHVAVEKLDDVYSATALMALYRRDVEWVGRIQCLHASMVASGKAEPRHHRKLHGLLIAIRSFGQANDLRQRFAIDVPVLPSLAAVAGDGMTVIGMADRVPAKRMVLSPHPDSGIQVIAMVHPLCGFSKRALGSILSDPRYAWLRPYLQLVVPREPMWSESAIRSWNEKHPDHPMFAQDMGKVWILMDTLETPVFHLLHKGNLIVSTTGWKGDGEELAVVRRSLEQLER